MEYDFLAALKSVGALKEGHFILTQGVIVINTSRKVDLSSQSESDRTGMRSIDRALADVGEIEPVYQAKATGSICSRSRWPVD